MICINCLTKDTSTGKRKYCSRKCAAEHRVKSKDYLEKLSNSAKSVKRPNLSEETKNKISESVKLNYLKNKNNRFTKETREKMSQSRKGKEAWNKNKTGLQSWTDERKRKHSASNKGGKCKWYEIVKDDGTIIKVQGTWELKFAGYLNKIDPNWIKPTIWDRRHQFNWFDKKGQSHWYTPDFWSPLLNKYFEIKGYWDTSQEEKKIFVGSLNNVEIIYKDKLNELKLI